MISLGNIHPLTDFKRDTARFRAQLKKTGQPAVLTVDGRPELVVQDAAAYQKMLETLERAEAIEGIRRGLESAKRGKVRSLEEADVYMRRKHGIRRNSP